MDSVRFQNNGLQEVDMYLHGAGLKALFLLSLLFSFVPGSYAEEASSQDHVVELEEVLVTAPAIIEGNEVTRYGSQKTVVSEEQISNLNAQDIPSALRKTPGVVISRHNPIGSFGGGEGGSIFIRGMGSSRPGSEIQTLVDGVPMFVSVWTHPLMDVLSVDNIDSIDVHKGAQPVLFGNMAFGSVNIHTKRKMEPGFSTKVQGAYGSHDTRVEILEHGGKVDKFDYYLVQSWRRSTGHRSNADGELHNHFGRAGYQLSDNWDVTMVLNHTDNWADDPGREDKSIPADGRFNTEDFLTVATLSNWYEWGEGYLKLYWDRGDIDWVDQEGTSGLDTLTDYDNYGVRARETFRPWPGGEIMAGLDIDYIGGEVDFLDPRSSDQHFPKETFRIVGPHFAFSQLIGSKQGLYAIPSAGFRYMMHSEFDDEPAPQAGIVLGYKNTEFHAFYSRGVNFPGVFVKVQNDIFLPGENKWKALNPEVLDHFEVGISQTFSEWARMDITYFYDDGQDRIVVSPPPPFPPVLKNVGKFRTRGAEATLTLSPAPELSLFAGLTYLDAYPEDLPYTPEWTASAGLNYRFFEKYQISLDALYVDEHFVTSRGRQEGVVNTDRVDSYFLLNGKLTYDFALLRGRLKCQAYIAGENLTDTEYEQKKEYPMPGISGMVGLVFKF